MKRTAWTRKQGPSAKPRKPLKPVSDKKAEWNRKYMAAKRAKMAEQTRISGGTYCERCLKFGDVDGHHPDGRLNEKILTFFLLCREDHDWCHAHKQAARAEGWFK